MHKRLWNSLKLEFVLQPVSPLLIKAGGMALNPAMPDMQFVRTLAANGETVFIPGSSLKGVFRSFTEKVLRTADTRGACQPFPNEPGYCGQRLEKLEAPAQIYKESCRACKVFGNTRLRGRLSFTDLYPNGPTRTEVRYGVAISRLTHAVAVGPFDMEVLVSGQFQGALVLENFEVWQLGLLALSLQALNEGIVKIGFGKNRGLGQVMIQVRQALLAHAKTGQIPDEELWGVGMFVSNSERENYGLLENDRLRGLPKPTQTKDLAILEQRLYDAEQWGTIEQMSTEALQQIAEARS